MHKRFPVNPRHVLAIVFLLLSGAYQNCVGQNLSLGLANSASYSSLPSGKCNLFVTYINSFSLSASIYSGSYYGYEWNLADTLPSGAYAFWMGTKNGVADLSPGDLPQPLTDSNGPLLSTGYIYLNDPAKAMDGSYTRYLVINDSLGNNWCTSNAVNVELEPAVPPYTGPLTCNGTHYASVADVLTVNRGGFCIQANDGEMFRSGFGPCLLCTKN